MKKFIEDNTYQSSFKEIDNLYSHIYLLKKFNLFFKIFLQRKPHAQMASLVTSSNHVRKKYQFIRILPENEKKRILPNLFFEARITTIPKMLQEMNATEQYFS